MDFPVEPNTIGFIHNQKKDFALTFHVVSKWGTDYSMQFPSESCSYNLLNKEGKIHALSLNPKPHWHSIHKPEETPYSPSGYVVLEKAAIIPSLKDLCLSVFANQEGIDKEHAVQSIQELMLDKDTLKKLGTTYE